jgi:hypothetical protein
MMAADVKGRREEGTGRQIYTGGEGPHVGQENTKYVYAELSTILNVITDGRSPPSWISGYNVSMDMRFS